MMSPGFVRGLVATALVALAIGCSSSSTGPSDPFAGAWSVTVKNISYTSAADSGYVTPTPFTLTIAKSGGTYTASYPAVELFYWSGTALFSVQFDASSLGLGTVTTSGDTLSIYMPNQIATYQCGLAFVGPASGGTYSGSVKQTGSSCGPTGVIPVGAFTATKQ